MGAAGGRRTNQRVDKKPRDPCVAVSANCSPKSARRDDRFEEKLGLEVPTAAILALFSHKRVARATSRGSGEVSRVLRGVGANGPGRCVFGEFGANSGPLAAPFHSPPLCLSESGETGPHGP